MSVMMFTCSLAGCWSSTVFFGILIDGEYKGESLCGASVGLYIHIIGPPPWNKPCRIGVIIGFSSKFSWHVMTRCGSAVNSCDTGGRRGSELGSEYSEQSRKTPNNPDPTSEDALINLVSLSPIVVVRANAPLSVELKLQVGRSNVEQLGITVGGPARTWRRGRRWCLQIRQYST